MKKAVFTFIAMGLMVFAFNGMAGALVLNFDDIQFQGDSAQMPAGYGGLNWSSDFRVNDSALSSNQDGPGWNSGSVSGDNAAYNGWGNSVTVTGDDFNFSGTYLTGAYNAGMNIQVIGLNNGATLFDTTIATSNDFSPTWFQFDYLGIDELQFIASGGTPFSTINGTQFLMDDFTYDPVPEPATLLLLGAGLTGVAATRRRKKSRG